MSAVKIQRKPVELRPDLTMWKIDGVLDSDSIGYIHKEFDSVLETDQKFLIAEMSGVSAVSSAALGQLMGCRQMLVERGGDLVERGFYLRHTACKRGVELRERVDIVLDDLRRVKPTGVAGQRGVQARDEPL